jgi:GNAT superfamily N-acetyltransferase
LRPFAGDDDYAAMAAVATAADPDHPGSDEYLRRTDAERDPRKVMRRVVAEVPGADVAGDEVVAFAHCGQFYGNADSRRLQIEMQVHPDFRRCGIGGALFDAVVREAVEALAPRRLQALECGAWERFPETARFLSRRGFRAVQRNPASELDLAAVDVAAFDAAPYADLEAELAASGVEIRSLGELMAGDPRWRERLYDLNCAVERDVPWYTDIEHRSFEEWAAMFRDNPDLLPEGHVVAVDGDLYVGLTQLWSSQATDRVLYTSLTGVRRSHRRRGIALALKVRSILHAATRRTADGGVPVIRTGNEEGNPMLGINRRLGFREVDAMVTWVKEMG